MEKPNPHKSNWSNMFLYLRCQVEKFAIEKWGSLEKLDEEFERRNEEKKERKEKKFQKKMIELRRKTKTSSVLKKKTQSHKHEFGEEFYDPETEEFSQTCVTCGLVTTYDKL